MSEQTLHPAESLQLIDSMINKAKNRFSENGHLYLIWGWVVLICSVGHFVMERVLGIGNASMIWFLTWAALIYQFIYLYKTSRKRTFTTYTDAIMGYVWFVFIVLGILLVVVMSRIINNPHQIEAILLVLYGMPTFLSGIIIRFPPLIRGAIVCWMLAIVSLFIPFQYHMLLIAVAVISAWILPGYMLRLHHKKMNA